MAFLSYQYLLGSKSEKLYEVIQLFTRTAIEVCEGQQLDIEFENRPDVSELEYLEMIRLKTAVLLACALKGGALLAVSNGDIAEQLYEFGINIGLAFQLQDDLLDTFGNQATFGKRIGGDILSNKKTLLLVKALEISPAQIRTELKEWLEKSEFIAEEKIKSVTKIYNQLKIKEIVQQKIDFYFQKALEIYAGIPVDENRKKILLNLLNNILDRVK